MVLKGLLPQGREHSMHRSCLRDRLSFFIFIYCRTEPLLIHETATSADVLILVRGPQLIR